VACQAPEHVIENRRLARPERKKSPRRKPAPRGFVPWNRETFERLVARPPEPLEPRFDVHHGLIVNVMQREGAAREPSGGYRSVLELIARAHVPEKRRFRLRRDAAAHFRSLRRAGIIKRAYDPDLGRHRVRVDEQLQWDFSLHHTLSLFLVEAVEVLDPRDPGYALQVLSLVESILEDPQHVLRQQAEKCRRELLARLKAAGVPYEERIQKLQEVSHPKPEVDFIYAAFDVFSETHPWVLERNVRPKAVAREMFEGYRSFDDYVREYGLQRSEGALLRYLGQVHHTLQQSVPERAKTEEVHDVVSFFRALLARVDSSLLEEWQGLLRPERGEGDTLPEPASGPAGGPEPRAFRARLRAEIHALVRALSRRDFEEATRCVARDPQDPWDAARFETALAAYFDEYEDIVFEPRARLAHHTTIREEGPRRWQWTQVLVDPRDENFWCVEGWVGLTGDRLPEEPLIRVRRIGT
jgi:hypothetical protein